VPTSFLATYDQNFSNTHIELGIIEVGVLVYGRTVHPRRSSFASSRPVYVIEISVNE
jgi:hypothetical protein